MRQPSAASLGPFFTVPNLLSLARFPLAAAFFFVESKGARLGLVGMASATDVLDGWAARHVSVTTRWGALLDPIADKTFVLAALSAFLLGGDLTGDQYVSLLLRDFATAIGFLVAYLMPRLDPADFRARYSGKVVTVLQLAAIVVVLLAPAWLRWLVPLTAIASAVAVADYTIALALVRARGAQASAGAARDT